MIPYEKFSNRILYITLAGIIGIGVLFFVTFSLIVLVFNIPLLIFYEWGMNKGNIK